MTSYLVFLTALFLGGLMCLLMYAVLLRRRLARKQKAIEEVLHMREHDLDKLKAAHTMLEAASKLDGSTGIPNRSGFEEAFKREWRRGLRNQTPVSLILIDIDAFTEYNDAVGHLGGDDCLRRVAAALKDSLLRPFDVLARFAGAGFACLLPETDEAGGVVMAERLREAVADLTLPHPTSTHGEYVTITQGVASVVPSPDEVSECLLDEAHSALKQAKERGHNEIWGDADDGLDEA